MKATAVAATRIAPSTTKSSSNGKSQKLSHSSLVIPKDERTPYGLEVPSLASPHIDDVVDNMVSYNQLDIVVEHGPHASTSGLLEIAKSYF